LFNFVFAVVNFIIFLIAIPYVINLLLGVKLFSFFKDRSAKIAFELEGALREKRETQETFSMWQTKIEKISDEIADLLLQGKTNGEKIKGEILASAKRRSENIIKESRIMADRETGEALKFLKRGILERSCELAREKIKRTLTKSGHTKLIDKSIEDLKEL